MSSDDIGAAFNRLDRLLAAAQDAGPSIALLMELGRQQGLGDQTVQKHLRLNTTVLRWCVKLSADATADRSELVGRGGAVDRLGETVTDAGFDALRAAGLHSSPVRGKILGCLTRFGDFQESCHSLAATQAA